MSKFIRVRGFGLLDKMVSMSVLSAVTAISLNQFQPYINEARDASLKSDLRNLALAQEISYVLDGEYVECDAHCTVGSFVNSSPDNILSSQITEDGRLKITASNTITGSRYEYFGGIISKALSD